MKIEMGESLFYSWLRHVKECQIVQTNWKASPQWQLQHEDELLKLMQFTSAYFGNKYGYEIYKKTNSLSQLIQQGECDAVGISIQNDAVRTYAIDVAFHESGLNYGSRETTVMKVISKSLRTAMCLYGFMDSKDAEIVFASPKINPSILGDLAPCIDDINNILKQHGFDFDVRVIANDDFNESVLKPILLVSDGVADTSELFLRGYQMYKMFSNTSTLPQKTQQRISKQETGDVSELKIGKLAQIVLRRMLEDGAASEDEINLMQTAEYSKQIFDIQFPLLVKANGEFDPVRYYAKPLTIRGVPYYLCSQWFESTANNDRPHLLSWIEGHKANKENFL
ncbi:MAG: hypothetical protein ACOX45_10940 [Acutalibacteraceae bacterium]